MALPSHRVLEELEEATDRMNTQISHVTGQETHLTMIVDAGGSVN